MSQELTVLIYVLYVKGNETKVVKAYAFLRNKEENSSGYRESNKTRVLYDFVALIWAKLKV